jgi:hypothetical protein
VNSLKTEVLANTAVPSKIASGFASRNGDKLVVETELNKTITYPANFATVKQPDVATTQLIVKLHFNDKDRLGTSFGIVQDSINAFC